MNVFRECAFILFSALLAAAGMHFLHPRAPAWYAAQEPLREDEVTLEMISLRWHDEVLWIDARSRAQYLAGHVPAALLLSEEAADQLLLQHFERLQDNTRPIIVYCGSEACQSSRKIAGYLREKLPTMKIYILRGGWNAWSQRHGVGVKS